MDIDLPLIWAAVIAVGVIMYVVLDGFDLGIGILFPLFPAKQDRDIMMNSVAPVWDGNETWMILGGAGLLGAFPLAYSVLLSALYLPLIFMLLALIFRGVAFEFRHKAESEHRWWDRAFAGGSLLATLMQGMALGAFIDGIAMEGRDYAGGPLDWLTPFTICVGVSLVLGYALLGAGWLVLKTEGELQERVWELIGPLLALVLLAVVAISIWTPLADPKISERWFSWPNTLYLLPVPFLVVLIGGALIQSVRKRQEKRPFVLTLALFILSYLGLAISLWPNIIPPDVTIWQAASPPESQGFMLVGIIILLPVVLGYTAYSYWIFRGKVKADSGYHL
ncbi:MAG: cyanide-insensitive cytochrome bd quinol oxidase subunit II [Rhodospirillales bacterium]